MFRPSIPISLRRAHRRCRGELLEVERPPADRCVALDQPEVIYRGHRPAMTSDEWKTLGMPAVEAERLAAIRHPAATRVSVVIITADGAGPLTHFPYHERYGFDWGFDGAGTKDLARAILLHHCGVTPTLCGELYPPVPNELPVDYEAFSREVIAGLRRSGPWSLTRVEIAEWIAARQLPRPRRLR
jgi:hypothetical protein